MASKVSPGPSTEKDEVEAAAVDSVDDALKDVVEFAAVEYLVFETDTTCTMTVARRGPCTRRVDLAWTNTDINFSPGTFKRRSGHVTLMPGESRVSFDMETIVFRNVEFTPEQLQDVDLAIVDAGGKGAASKFTMLGDLRRCRVVTLNADTFPHGVADQADVVGVLRGFAAHNYAVLKPQTKRGLWLRLAPGVCYVANNFVTQYMIKTVSLGYLIHARNGATPPQYTYYIFLLACCYFVIFLIDAHCDLEFLKLKLGGASCRALRCAIMDTVTQLTPLGEEEYDVGRVMKIADVQVADAVQSSWVAWFGLWASLGKLTAMVAFICYTAIASYHTSGNPLLLGLIAIPFVMIALDGALLVASIGPAQAKNLSAMEADDAWSSFMAQASFMRQVVTTFRKGFKITSVFEQTHKEFNAKQFAAGMFSKRTQWRANTIPTAVAAGVIALVGTLVVQGDVGVEVFVVFVSTVNSFGPTLGQCFTALFDIGKGYASIRKVAALLNMDTRRKQLLRGQQRRAKRILSYESTLPSGAPEFDPEAPRLLMHDVTYLFQGQREHEQLLLPLNVNLDAGQVVVLEGSGSVGKKMILRLLARHFIPKGGFISYPSRWRLRFLDATPAFFGGDMNKLRDAETAGPGALAQELDHTLGTLEYNVKFGAQFQHPDEKVWDAEIFALLQLLWVSEELIGGSVEEFRDGTPDGTPDGRPPKKKALIGLNGEKLSLTDRALLTLARALLSSVDLLLISNVLDLLGAEHGIHVLGVLKELTTHRCLRCLATEAASTPPHLRKQKLVIFSTKLGELANVADEVLDVSGSMMQAAKKARLEENHRKTRTELELRKEIAGSLQRGGSLERVVLPPITAGATAFSTNPVLVSGGL